MQMGGLFHYGRWSIVLIMYHPYNSFRPLCKEHLDEDFIHNIIHLQAGKRSKVLSLFRQAMKDISFSEMEVFNVYSLLELQHLRRLFRAFPIVLFSGSYVRIRVQIYAIDHVVEVPCARRILDDFAQHYNCEVPDQEVISQVAKLAEALVPLRMLALEIPRNNILLSDWGFQKLGEAGLLARGLGTFAPGGFGDLVFDVTKRAISCANTGLSLVEDDINSTRRWTPLLRRLGLIQFDVESLLQNPLYLSWLE